MRTCKCGCQTFKVEHSGASCCLTITFTCSACGEEEICDYGTGEC